MTSSSWATPTMSVMTYDHLFLTILGISVTGIVFAALWIVAILIGIEANKAAFYSINVETSLEMTETTTPRDESGNGLEVEKTHDDGSSIAPSNVSPVASPTGASGPKKRARRVRMSFKLMQVASVCCLVLLTYLLLVVTSAPMWASAVGSIIVFGIFLRYQIGDEIRRQRVDRIALMMSLFLMIAGLMSLCTYCFKSLGNGEIYEGPARIIGYNQEQYNNTEHDPSTRADLLVQWGKDWGCPLSGGKVCQAQVHGAMCTVNLGKDEDLRRRHRNRRRALNGGGNGGGSGASSNNAKASASSGNGSGHGSNGSNSTSSSSGKNNSGNSSAAGNGNGKNSGSNATSTNSGGNSSGNSTNTGNHSGSAPAPGNSSKGNGSGSGPGPTDSGEDLEKENEELEEENEELKKEVEELELEEQEEAEYAEEKIDEVEEEEKEDEAYYDEDVSILEEEELDVAEEYTDAYVEVEEEEIEMEEENETDPDKIEADEEEIEDLEDEEDEVDEIYGEYEDEYDEAADSYEEQYDEAEEAAEEDVEKEKITEKEYDEAIENIHHGGKPKDEDEIQDEKDEIVEKEKEDSEGEDIDSSYDEDGVRPSSYDDSDEEDEWYWDEITYEYDDDWYESEYWEYDWDSAWGEYACEDLFDGDTSNVVYDTSVPAGEDDYPFITIYGSCKTCEAYILDYFAEEAFESVQEYKQQAAMYLTIAVSGMIFSFVSFIKYRVSPQAENEVELLGDGGVMA